MDMSILPADKFVFLKIGDVVVGRIGLQLEEQPSDVRMEKTLRNIIGIVVVIDMLMMAAMFAGPHQNRVFESGRAKDESEQPDGPAGTEGEVRKQPVITERNAKTAREKHHEEKRDLKPIETEMVKVKGDRGER